jgi:hypothetical protein
MGEISVDLQTRIIPKTHNVFVARPGKDSRLFGTFHEQQAIGPDFPGLGLKRGVPLNDQVEIERRVRRSIRLRNWHLSGRVKEDEPDRELRDYRGAEPKGMGQYRAILSGYFDRAAKGDLAIVTPKSWALRALVVEFRDPVDIVEIPVEFYPHDPLSGRRVRILAQIEKRRLPGKVLDIVEKPNAFVLLERSVRPIIYRLAYGSYVLDGSIATEFDVSSEDYKFDDDLLMSAFFKFVAINTVNVSIQNKNQVFSVEDAVFRELGKFSPDFRSNVNSPGFLQYTSDTIIPLVASALFALAVTVGPAASQAAKDKMITIGNSRAPAGDVCTAQVSESVLTQLKLLELDQWAKACEIARKIHESAGLTGTATVKPDQKKK